MHICQRFKPGISPAYAARLFQRHTGQSVRKYARKKRLLRAVEQLTETERPIKAIAAELGYRVPSDLARAFRNEYGLTPRGLRNKYQLVRMSQQDWHFFVGSVLAPLGQGRTSNAVPQPKPLHSFPPSKVKP
jgi:AraC-like DNA-binding protein